MSSSTTATTAATGISQSVLNKILGFYMDQSARQKAPRDGKGNLIVNFGKTIQGRLSKVVTFYLKNEHMYPIQLEAKATDPDLMFLSYPKSLYPGQIQKMDVAFRCPLDRINPLSSNFGFDIVINPPISEP